jgi:hypothetical protein
MPIRYMAYQTHFFRYTYIACLFLSLFFFFSPPFLGLQLGRVVPVFRPSFHVKVAMLSNSWRTVTNRTMQSLFNGLHPTPTVERPSMVR